MKSERVMALSLAKLGLTVQGRNRWVAYVKKQKDPDFDLPWNSKGLSLLKQWANEVTVRDVVDALEASLHPLPSDLRKFDKKLVKRLVELGMTQLDWIALPNTTVTTAALRRLGKEKLRSLSILVLDTLSSKALQYFLFSLESGNRGKKSLREVTIQHLLDFNAAEGLYGSPLKTHLFLTQFAGSFHSTRCKLLELGFRYEDGRFLQAGTKRRLAEDLMESDGLSKKLAYRFAEIVRKRNLIPEFIE